MIISSKTPKGFAWFLSLIIPEVAIFSIMLASDITGKKHQAANLVVIIYNTNTEYTKEKFTGYINSEEVFTGRYKWIPGSEIRHTGKWIYLRLDEGKHKLTIKSGHGREAVVDVTAPGNGNGFVGYWHSGGVNPEVIIDADYDPGVIY